MNSGKRKRILTGLLAVCLTAVMTGCGGPNSEERQPSPTLAPARIGYLAPDGDRAVRRAGYYTLYLPDSNELQLASRTVYLEEVNLETTAETLVRMLLEEDGSRGENRRTLSLYRGKTPEISGGICTVNLDPAALQLDYREYYMLSVALATTLCSLNEINGVNVLTADRSAALDTAGNLAMGTLTGHPGENLPVLWEQMAAKRTPLGNDVSRTPLSAAATVYYPLTEGRGISCESRMMTFPGQTPNQMAETLLSALSEAVRSRNGDGDLPELAEYLLHLPVTSELEDGGKLVTVSFRENIGEMLEKWDTDLPCLIAAVTCTLTTFIPGVAAVCVRIGDKPVTEMSNDRYSTGTILGGLVHRSDAEIFLTGSISVFFEKDGKLTVCSKPVERELADSPRVMLEALIEGPDRKERESGVSATMPEAISEDDILGIASEGDMLLVNLSEVVRSEIRSAGPEKEALLCYSMVNTLCLNSGLRRVCFFFEGQQAEYVAGEIYWGGEFIYNPGI